MSEKGPVGEVVAHRAKDSHVPLEGARHEGDQQIPAGCHSRESGNLGDRRARTGRGALYVSPKPGVQYAPWVPAFAGMTRLVLPFITILETTYLWEGGRLCHSSSFHPMRIDIMFCLFHSSPWQVTARFSEFRANARFSDALRSASTRALALRTRLRLTISDIVFGHSARGRRAVRDSASHRR